MKILSIALLSVLSTVRAEEAIPQVESALAYVPPAELSPEMQYFVQKIFGTPQVQQVTSTFAYEMRGHTDNMLISLDKHARYAAILAHKVSQQNWPVRKNMLNHLRDTALKIVQKWCEPKHSWFCEQVMGPEAVYLIDQSFCSSYSPEMAEQSCYPEAVNDYNKARLGRAPFPQF